MATAATPSPPDTREGRPTTCRLCGEAAYWHKTVRGKWILIQPGAYACHLVPPGKRWRIAPDGTAINLGAATPTDTCRISHFDTCPQRPPTSPTPDSPPPDSPTTGTPTTR